MRAGAGMAALAEEILAPCLPAEAEFHRLGVAPVAQRDRHGRRHHHVARAERHAAEIAFADHFARIRHHREAAETFENRIVQLAGIGSQGAAGFAILRQMREDEAKEIDHRIQPADQRLGAQIFRLFLREIAAFDLAIYHLGNEIVA